MDITPLIPKNHNVINSYGGQGFTINETLYHDSIILTHNQILQVRLEKIEDFFEQNLKKIFDFEPEILLIGTGKNHQIIPVNLKNKVRIYYPAISIDEMSTGSACRTYNILMSEGRNVVALLMEIK
ncbi:MAG: hypothetical protein K0R25_1206 [Rickettsiaceae bacterium]|jgi:uncharacterized protein|nr:hypothetical protein [Rickettsiaceae bacterium]